jgi:preprotein translocase subunit SecE
MTVRRVATILTVVMFLVAAVGLYYGHYSYTVTNTERNPSGPVTVVNTHVDRSGDRPGLMLMALLGAAFAAAGIGKRWLAIGSVVVASVGLYLLNKYPTDWAAFWGQSLAVVCYGIAIVGSLGIATTEEVQTRLFKFVRESYVETTQKSAWPTWTELRQFTMVVLFAIIVVSIWVGGIDFILTKFTANLGQ